MFVMGEKLNVILNGILCYHEVRNANFINSVPNTESLHMNQSIPVNFNRYSVDFSQKADQLSLLPNM